MVLFDFSSRLLKRTMSLSDFLLHVKSQLVGKMRLFKLNKICCEKLNGDG